MSTLGGKSAVVTGAGRGIGRAIAEAYAGAGARVACLARTGGEIRATADAIRRAGGTAVALELDVRDRDAVERVFERAHRELEGLDLVVINAGVDAAPGPLDEVDPDAWVLTLETNLLGAYHCARASVPYLRARGGGKIITVGSGLGHRGLPGTSAYACSKAGLWMLTRVLAQELAPDRISVNELIPGPVETRLTPASPGRPGVGPRSPSEWRKRPSDVVPLALFLAEQPLVGPTAQSFSLMRRDG